MGLSPPTATFPTKIVFDFSSFNISKWSNIIHNQSKSKTECSLFTAFSTLISSINTEILISEVVIAKIFIFSL